jgi:tetratricopeptide (TPR) repeat protein
VAGWNWRPELSQPLYWLITLPFRLLPESSVAMGLNIFSALLASAALYQLVRSVTLLPHDRTQDQRNKEKSPYSLLSIPTAWLPPVLAVIVCGLQFTFWENATSASGEMLNLVIFSYLVRCLLEFRVDKRESWLLRFAVVCGAAIANDWVFIAFLPLFLASLFWLRGRDFFRIEFLVKMFLCGLLGLSVYLLLPIVQASNPIFHVPFWTGLKSNLGAQKGMLLGAFHFLKIFKQDALVLCIISLFPILLISIRWSSYFGDTSPLGIVLATTIFNVIHAVFLLICVWVAMDPPFSPRFSLMHEQYGFPFLTTAYLSSLAVGYFAGYFLLVFRKTKTGGRRQNDYPLFLNNLVTGFVWFLLLLAPIILLFRNLPQIRTANGKLMKEFASHLAGSLPQEGAIVLSDDPLRLMALQAFVASSGKTKNFALVETSPMKFPEYHRFLKKHYPSRWTEENLNQRKRPYEDLELVYLVANLGRSNELYYLHPSFGYYFEAFYPEPRGLAYKLHMFSNNMVFPAKLSEQTIDYNENFWDKTAVDFLKNLRDQIDPQSDNKTNLIKSVLKVAELRPVPLKDAVTLAVFYSRALNYWGVEEQRANKLMEAGKHFELAAQLNSENVVARINLDCNRNLLAQKPAPVLVSRDISEEFGKYRGWEQVLNVNGPFDEPNFCYELGKTLRRGQDYRQSAVQFRRAAELDTNQLPARISLAELYVVANQPQAALALLKEIRAQPGLRAGLSTNRSEILAIETSAYLSLKDPRAAEAAANAILEKDPENPDLLNTAAIIYMNNAAFSNAVPVIERQLKLSPNNIELLINKAYAYIGMEAFDAAIETLTQALTIDPNNKLALLNRAIAYLRSGKLDNAKKDYEQLEKANSADFRIPFGLGEIAFRQHDTNAAIQYYESYLRLNPPLPDEVQSIKQRLQELKPSP